MLFKLFNLLTDTTDGGDKGGTDPWVTYVIMGVAILLIVVMMIFSRRSQKKKQEETNAMLDAIAPGNKVKTIGGICGVVVEVCKEDNTFILETGSDKSGKSYIRFDKQAVYQTDAKAPTAEATANENAEPTAEAAPASEVFTETAPEAAVEVAAPEAPVETQDAPVEEATEEKAE